MPSAFKKFNQLVFKINWRVAHAEEEHSNKTPKTRKVAAAPQRWPYEYEHTNFPDDEDDGDIVIDHMWARDAIFHGNAVVLARYLRETKEIDPRIRRELAAMLNPTSNHTWRLHTRYRFRGVPSKQAKTWKTTFDQAILPFAKLLSGKGPN